MRISSLFLDLQNEARKLNHKEVVDEDKRNKLPSNYEARKRRAEWEIMDDEKRKVICFHIIFQHFSVQILSNICSYDLQVAEEAGQDYDRLKVLDVSAEDAEKYERIKMRKSNPDPGFSGNSFS